MNEMVNSNSITFKHEDVCRMNVQFEQKLISMLEIFQTKSRNE